ARDGERGGLPAGSLLGLQLRPAIDLHRVGLVGFGVRAACGAVENVVGAYEDHEGGACGGGDVARPIRIRGARASRIDLTAVDVGPRRGVDDDVWARRFEHAFNGDRIGDVERLVVEQDCVVCGETRCKLGAELPAGAGHKDTQTLLQVVGRANGIYSTSPTRRRSR